MVATADGPLDREDLRSRVQKALDAFLALQQARLTGVAEELAPLVECVSDLLSGGKRLRPAFCYWGFRGAGGPDVEAVVAAASALELFQACALVHDDVMDGSDTRRGAPAVHRRFGATHRQSGWLGDPEAFGEGAAILLGDLCLSWSDELLRTSGVDPAALARALPVFDRMRTELMGGQYLDLLEQARGGGSVERAMRVARYKSAKYTIEQPLLLGAALAGAGAALAASYSAYGLPLGEAFQLRDDVLGVFGDPTETGKPAGDDLREGKRTVLVALAVQNATAAQQALVRRHLGDPHLDDDGVAALREVLRDTGALRRVEAMVEELRDRALAALASAEVPPVARAALQDLADAATRRAT